MVMTLALAIQAIGGLPEHPGFDFSGLPTVQGGLHAQTCGVTILTTDDYCDVSSQTVYKNAGAAGSGTVTIPRRRFGDGGSGNPSFAIQATWDNKPVSLGMQPGSGGKDAGNGVSLYSSDLKAKVPMAKGGTHVLRIHYRTMLGKCGFDRKQKIVGYWLDGTDQIDGLNVAYQYGGKTVFRLPEVNPDDFGWQVGSRGAFIRKQAWTPGGQMTFLSFYPGGFKPIGDGAR